MSCLLSSSTSGATGLTFCFQVLVTSVLRSEILKLIKSDTLRQITKKVSESKWKNRQTELSSRKRERNRMIGGKIHANIQKRIKIKKTVSCNQTGMKKKH